MLDVIFTTYNEDEGLLKKSIGSVLSQSFIHFKLIIVVEPGDVNSDLIHNYRRDDNRIVVIENSCKVGFVASLNKALLASSSQYVARMDSDDFSHPDRFKKQIEYLDNHLDVDVIGGWIDYDDSCFGVRKYPEHHSDIKRTFLFSTPIAHPAVMVRRSAFESYGLYNERFLQSEDLELWLRLLKNGCKFYNLQSVVLTYHIKESSGLEGRRQQHWYYNYKARVLHGKEIFSLVKSRVSIFLFWLLSKSPIFFYGLVNRLFAKYIKNIR